MSSPKPETKMSVEQQVKAGLRAVRDFLAGRSGDDNVVATEDKATRDVVAAELPARISGSAAAEPRRVEEEQPLSDAQQISAYEAESAADKTRQSDSAQNSNEGEQERERARELYLAHGYFDEAVEALRSADSPAQRVADARALGMAGSERGTAHLIAAMFDDDPQVRSAAEIALDELNAGTIVTDAVDVMNQDVRKINESGSLKSVIAQQGEGDARGADEVAENALMTSPTAQLDHPPQPTEAGSGLTPELIAVDQTATSSSPTVEEEQLLLEEHRIRESIEQLTLQLFETTAARKQSEQEVQSRTEREAALIAEAVARRNQEEEIRKRTDEEAERHRAEERRTLAIEQVARARAEAEAQRLAEQETRLRLQGVDLRMAVAELVRRRVASETARREAAEAARQAEANRLFEEAKTRHDAEQARLLSEEEALRTTAEKIVLRRAEVEAAREKADAEAERLVEARARMRAAADAGAQAEAERAQLEAEINQRTAAALRLLDETRRRGKEEHERLQEETRREVEAQQHRLAEVELTKTRAEAESRQLAEKEQQILTQINSLRFVDSQTRKRIEDAEVRKHAAEEAYRLVAEKVQRVEAEAHSRVKEEEQILARLEAERRSVAVEAQSRAAQIKRIRDEIEMFRRLEEQERPLLEAATLQRKQAETRLQELREQLKGSADAGTSSRSELHVSAHETGNRMSASDTVEIPRYFTASVAGSDKGGRSASYSDEGDAVGRTTTSPVTPSIFAYLNSVDPYKRAAAVAELARSGSPDAFSLIVNCFDDSSPHVRNAAARALHKLEPNRTVDLFNRALEEASDERRRNLGAAIAASGLATEAIKNLVGDNREETYKALSILFVMAKTGEVEPLVRALEEHPNDEIGKAVTRLLNLSGHGRQ
jgi:hypothetical protein